MAPVSLGRLITLVRRGQRPACVMLPGAGGGLHPYLRLAGFFGETRNVYGMRAAGLVPGEEPEDRLDVMADVALQVLDDAQVVPDLVFGWSMGGSIGWELCVRLAERGVHPDLILLDSSPLPRAANAAENAWLRNMVTEMLGPRPDAVTIQCVQSTLAAQMAALVDYRATRPYSGRVLLISCADPDPTRDPSRVAWRRLSADLREEHIDAEHYQVLEAVHLPSLVALMAPFLEREPVR